MKVVQQVENDIARRGDEIVVPRLAIAVDRHRATAAGQKTGSKPDVSHVFERRPGDITAVTFVTVRDIRTIVQHGDAVADEFSAPVLQLVMLATKL